MKTVLVDEKQINLIAHSLNEHQVIAFPTETVFGLGVKFDSLEGLKRIYEIKKREKNKAVTLMVATKEEIENYAYINEKAKKVIQAFMPGKITLVLKKKASVDDLYTSGLSSIGIRIPDDAFVLDLLKKVGPMWVTSANLSGQPDMIRAENVYDTFKNQVALVVKKDAGNDLASTVVDLQEDCKILRMGSIKEEEIMEVVT